MNGKVVPTYVNVYQNFALNIYEFHYLLLLQHPIYSTIFVKLGVPQQHHKTLYAL